MGALMRTRNPFVRVARSIGKHGVVNTVRMAWGLSKRNLPHVIPNARVKWAKLRHGGVVVRTVQGSRMKLDLSDEGISRELYLTGVHEPNSTRQFREELKPGMTLLEIGANIGYYTLIGLQRVGPTGTIIALEPSPVNLDWLSENLQLNGVDGNVKIYPNAAGRERRRLPFYHMPSGNLSTLVEGKHGQHLEARSVHEVEVVPLDDLVAASNLKIDYFRMDVEGYEAEIIDGMASTLTGKDAPAGAFIEVHSDLLKEAGSSARTFVERMYSLGYRLKAARFVGGDKEVVYSNSEFSAHPLADVAYWEAFFARRGCDDVS